jgi:transcriptional regulator with XRE-family HTH domain
MIADKPTSGKELRQERLAKSVSRRRHALFAKRSEERIAQIERKSYVSPAAARRYRIALAAAVAFIGGAK